MIRICRETLDVCDLESVRVPREDRGAGGRANSASDEAQETQTSEGTDVHHAAVRAVSEPLSDLLEAEDRGEPLTLYLRVRAVEWNIAEQQFECVADEILGSPLFGETCEVRGSARTEQHFAELQQALRVFEFDVTTHVDGMLALQKREVGTGQ